MFGRPDLALANLEMRPICRGTDVAYFPIDGSVVLVLHLKGCMKAVC